jgi:hypothetical protein
MLNSRRLAPMKELADATKRGLTHAEGTNLASLDKLRLADFLVLGCTRNDTGALNFYESAADPYSGFCISRDCPMKALVSALACLIPLTAFAAEEDVIMQKAFRIITQHRLLSRAELACSFLMLDGVTKTVATVTVREKHGGKCGGAPETAPRRFTIEIDLKTGAAQWDRNDAMEMEPIP